MITNFEKETYELTTDEMELLPLMVKCFERHDKYNPIKAEKIVKETNAYLKERDVDIQLTGARLRKIVNYIRSNGIIPLIATSEGYYVSYDKDIIRKQIKSLVERSNSIMKGAHGLSKYAL